MGQLLPIEGEYAWIRFGEAAKPRWIDQGNGTYELQFLVGVLIHLHTCCTDARGITRRAQRTSLQWRTCPTRKASPREIFSCLIPRSQISGKCLC
jgi:hypothetical protein